MQRLDRSRDYAEVWGASGMFCYEQDDRQYRLDGSPHDDASPVAVPVSVTPAPRRGGWPKGRPRQPRAVSEPAVSEDASQPDSELRAMVDIAGGEWAGREAAIAFLADPTE